MTAVPRTGSAAFLWAASWGFWLVLLAQQALDAFVREAPWIIWVAYLLPLYERLRAEAEAAGKLPWILEEGEVACAGAGSRNPAYHLRVKSAWKLEPRQFAALERLCAWREEEAALRDKPRSWILDDTLCLAIARAMPGSAAALAAAGEIPPAVLRRCGDALLDCIAEARSLPEAALPAPLPPPLDSGERKRLKGLKSRVRALAEAAAVAAEVTSSTHLTAAAANTSLNSVGQLAALSTEVGITGVAADGLVGTLSNVLSVENLPPNATAALGESIDAIGAALVYDAVPGEKWRGVEKEHVALGAQSVKANATNASLAAPGTNSSVALQTTRNIEVVVAELARDPLGGDFEATSRIVRFGAFANIDGERRRLSVGERAGSQTWLHAGAPQNSQSTAQAAGML